MRNFLFSTKDFVLFRMCSLSCTRKFWGFSCARTICVRIICVREIEGKVLYSRFVLVKTKKTFLARMFLLAYLMLVRSSNDSLWGS
ncbi:hypothetical protein QL285_012528 [Trifolium repens]|nr:hypothetical protein QL285_012528 [Trifolium repens]